MPFASSALTQTFLFSTDGRSVSVEIENSNEKLHEAQTLRLDCSKAKQILGWHPRLSFEDSAEQTIEWYDAYLRNADMQAFTKSQIDSYVQKS